jgi:hypothetical protein
VVLDGLLDSVVTSDDTILHGALIGAGAGYLLKVLSKSEFEFSQKFDFN